MAERIAAELFLKLGSYAIQQIGLAWGVEKELAKMENNISTIRGILLHAEERQLSDGAVKAWLQRLQLILYDADDLLDEVATETKRRQVETQNGLVGKVHHFFTTSPSLAFRYVVGRKLKDIEKRLDEIVLEMNKFKFLVKQVGRPIETLTRDETHSFVNTLTIVGREIDKEKIVSLLLFSNYEENVPIIPIVGMGGLGKTTLAQLVYNDHRIQNHFAKRVFWVCISDDFNIERILIKILQAGGANCSNSEGLEHLQNQVRNMLSVDQFLLFLDDVWSEDIVEWKTLENFLITGARGSRIVVTTRSKEVASIVKTGTVIPYELRGLSEDQCLEILVKWAFKEGENKHQNLVNIGREIVKKCGGVPLAARTLGAMLRSKSNECDWLSVRDSEMWALVQKKNDMLPILKWSYDQMPPLLKHCFAYCSLFEKDEIMSGRRLMYHWMAQGFLQCSDREKELEDIGEGYILELVRRCFLEPVDKWELDRWDENYKMHDLVHDLAQYVAGSECLTIKGAITKAIPVTVRHVSFTSIEYCKLPRLLSRAKKLRTTIFPKYLSYESGSSVEPRIVRFRSLRVLENCCFDDFSELKKIGKLKLLRYLNLSGVTNLPKSLCKLLNLEYLDLSSLDGVSKLPEGFEKLINLRFLRLSIRLTCLSEKDFCRLTSLRTLIIWNCTNLTTLGEGIELLSCLRELTIADCPELSSLAAGLRHLVSLERLFIWSCPLVNWSDGDYDLKGLKSLKKLRFEFLPKLVTLPKGLQDAAATLTHLEIVYCESFTLPSECILPNLQSLQSLKIEDCGEVESLPEGMQGLTELQFLSISRCNLEKNRYREGGEDWHIPTTEIFDYMDYWEHSIHHSGA